MIDPNPISVTIGARDQDFILAKLTGIFERWINKLRMDGGFDRNNVKWIQILSGVSFDSDSDKDRSGPTPMVQTELV